MSFSLALPTRIRFLFLVGGGECIVLFFTVYKGVFIHGSRVYLVFVYYLTFLMFST